MFALTWCLLLYFSARSYAFDLQVNATERSPVLSGQQHVEDLTPLDDVLTRVKREKVPKHAVRLSTGIYRFHFKTMTWVDAFKFCRSKDMELVAIESEEENVALAEHGIKTGFFAPFNGAWTSACFQPFQGDYVWFSTGAVVNYRNWAPMHPLVAAADFCITFYPPDSQWLEAPADIFRPVICVFVPFAVMALLAALVGSSPLPRERLRGRREHLVRRGNSRPVSDKPNTWAYEDYALPTDLRPLEYTVHLIPYFEDPPQTAFTFDGTVKALFHVDVATDVIRMHAGFDVNVNKISVTVRKDGLIGNEVGVGLVNQVPPDDLRDFLTINLLSTLEVNSNYTVEMSFWGHLNDDAEGFFRSSYTDSNGVQRWIGVTHMETVSARRAFPCWDEPAWKAVFIMHIAHAPDRHVISNMPVFRDIELVPNMPLWRYTEFEPTPLMSTYLICWLVSDFEYIQSVQDPRVKTWARPGQAANTHYGNDVAPRLISYMEYFTGYPYMLPKMDQAAVPGFASGAMENWGLLTYREGLMVYLDGFSGTRDRENTEAITAHEVSHQWFGDLVSPQWWDNLWLNEGFARYFEYHGLLDIEPTWQYGERYVYEQMHYVLVVDSLNETHPMFVQGVDSPYATYDMFDSISYEKGSCIVRFMINLLGENNFMTGAHDYMVNKQYSNAVMDDLWAAMEPHVPPGQLPPGVSFKQVMDTWTLQAGYPVIRVIRDYATNRAFITQRRFVTDSNDPYFEVYMTPITLTTELAPNFDDLRVWGWQGGTELVISSIPASSTQWIIVNLKQTGYYRVNYDTQNWQLLAAGLESRPRDFHQINRGQLINDAITLAEAGELDYTTALGMTRYMALETDCMPWSTAFDTLVYTNLRMDYLLEYRNLYTGYMLPRLAPVYSLVNGFGFSDNDLHVIKIERQVIIKWACALDDPACNAEGSALFTQWLNTPNPDLNNPIHPDLKDTVYCAGMRLGGQAEFDFLFARYANVPPEVYGELERIEFALGCSADTAMLTQYLDRSLDRTSALHGRFCFYAVVDNWRGVDLALDWLIANWQDAIVPYGGYYGIERSFSYLGHKLNTAEQRQKLQTFLDENSAALLGAKAGVEEAIATLDKILAWHAAYGQEVVDYFRNNP